MSACTCTDHATYRQLDRDCPQHGDEAEQRRRSSGGGSDTLLDSLRAAQAHVDTLWRQDRDAVVAEAERITQGATS